MDLEPILRRIEALERRNGEFAHSIAELRDAVVVVVDVQRAQADTLRQLSDVQQAQAAVQRQQADVQRQQADVQRQLGEVQRYMLGVQQSIAEGLTAHEHTIRATNETLERFRLTMAEFEGKLNGVIGYIENFFRRPPPEEPR